MTYLHVCEHIDTIKKFSSKGHSVCLFVRRFLSLLSIFFFLFSFALSAHVKASPSEFELKAAYLYKIIKFIEWPENAFASTSSPLHLCVVGKSKLPDTFYQLSGNTVKNRRLKISNIKKSALDDIAACNLVYVTFRDVELMAKFITQIINLPIVTVSDAPNFVNRQGMIGLVNKSEYLTIEVNLGVANAANIDVRAQLLEVASHVIRPMGGL